MASEGLCYIIVSATYGRTVGKSEAMESEHQEDAAEAFNQELCEEGAGVKKDERRTM